MVIFFFCISKKFIFAVFHYIEFLLVPYDFEAFASPREINKRLRIGTHEFTCSLCYTGTWMRLCFDIFVRLAGER